MAGAGSLQRSQAGEPRPSGESGTGTPKEGGTESQAGDKLKLITDEAASLNRPS